MEQGEREEGKISEKGVWILCGLCGSSSGWEWVVGDEM